MNAAFAFHINNTNTLTCIQGQAGTYVLTSNVMNEVVETFNSSRVRTRAFDISKRVFYRLSI